MTDSNDERVERASETERRRGKDHPDDRNNRTAESARNEIPERYRF